MNLLYVDESGDTGKTGTDHLVLGAAAFADLVSRFDLFLKRRYREGFPSKGMIIADPRNSALSRALRKSVLQFHDTGTPWAALENVIESVIFLELHESPGLQLAAEMVDLTESLADFDSEAIDFRAASESYKPVRPDPPPITARSSRTPARSGVHHSQV